MAENVRLSVLESYRTRGEVREEWRFPKLFDHLTSGILEMVYKPQVLLGVSLDMHIQHMSIAKGIFSVAWNNFMSCVSLL